MDMMDEHATVEADEQVTFTAAEIAGMREAIADLKLRGSIPLEEVTAWLDSLDTDHPLPEPQPRKFT
jgi:hypothetical protein